MQEDFLDSYANLTIKSLMMLKLFFANPGPQYLLKATQQYDIYSLGVGFIANCNAEK